MYVSCSNNSSTFEFDGDQNSLRSIAVNRERNINWIIKEDTYTQEQSSTWQSESKLVFQNQGTMPIFLSHFNIDVSVYPTLNGFGSLNISTIPLALDGTLRIFLDAVKDNNIDISMFPEHKSYLKVLIDYNMRDYSTVDRYVIGEAFKADNSVVYEIPIRIYFENGYANCTIFSSLVENDYKIEQFDIGKMMYE